MKLHTLTLAAALAFAGSAFAATGYGYGHDRDLSKHIQAAPHTTLRHEAHPMKRVALVHHRHHVKKHVAVVKPMHRRDYAFTRHDKVHLAASSHPQRRNS